MVSVAAAGRRAVNLQIDVRKLLASLPLGVALFSSGAAGLVNQVVWQRALKVFLGGSEAVSSMIVVLVFMAGLGAGSIWMGTKAARLRRPLFAFAVVELILAAVNVAVCAILASNISQTVFQVQTVALSIGVPLLLVYAIGATVVLALPCLLMGMTMPLAAESCQRSLGLRDSKLLGLLFFVNTLGSVGGALMASGYMIPQFGQNASLIIAALLNVAAGVLMAVQAIAFRTQRERAIDAEQVQAPASSKPRWRPGAYEILAFGLGFCSLGYEMYLFRLIPLRHEPLPFTFAAVLTGYLLFWSLGAAAHSVFSKLSIGAALRCCALASVATVVVFLVDSFTPVVDTGSLCWFVLAKFPYFIPCFLFGYLFALVASSAAESWGKDVGRIYGWNTFGCCLGVLGMTLVGYQMPFFLMIVVVGLLLYAMQEFAISLDPVKGEQRRQSRQWQFPLVAAAGVTVAAIAFDFSRIMPGVQMYSGKAGVIMIDDHGNMVWDGLWHSKLSRDNDHVGTNNWYLAVCPILCHPTGEIEDVCVIGVATGITASTLAKLETVQKVDGYDISRMLEKIYRDHPEGTLGIADNPKINIIWQDARTGLELNEKKYDIIQAQPLYLKQAGSALLNSVEFYELVRRRLKPGGVFCLYSNGTAEQAFAVRETADQVFAHRESFFNGYLVILSNDPIRLDADTLYRRMSRQGALWNEIRNWPATATVSDLMTLVDRPALPRADGQLTIRDVLPIVEYPNHLADEVSEHYPNLYLPTPRQGKTQ
jgi:predicted membrane-bound spermidine synthase